MGRDFFPVLAAMLSWGHRWLDDGGGAPVTLHHHKPGHNIVSQVVCVECGEPISHADIQFRVGPGYPDDISPPSWICATGWRQRPFSRPAVLVSVPRPLLRRP